jgi:hypothetical protein
MNREFFISKLVFVARIILVPAHLLS